jgi:hypothetical protein
MARKPLIISPVQIESAEVGSRRGARSGVSVGGAFRSGTRSQNVGRGQSRRASATLERGAAMGEDATCAAFARR